MAATSRQPYDESLFAGTAAYYAKYRAPYPDALIADIVSHYGLDGSGRLLDLGCGPGTLTFALAGYFAGTVAVDPQVEMIAEGRRLSPLDSQIEWRVMAAEDVSPGTGMFRLVTCGSSFHWMDRDLVLAKVAQVLAREGGMAFAGMHPWWEGREEWHKVITRLVQRYLGEERRAGTTVFKATGELFEETLERNGWSVELNKDYETTYEWDLDSVIGQLWSTSFASRAHFGERVDDFEGELRAELMALIPDGPFCETGMSGLVCGRPPA